MRITTIICDRCSTKKSMNWYRMNVVDDDGYVKIIDMDLCLDCYCAVAELVGGGQ